MPPGKSWKRICLATPRTSDNIANGVGTILLHRLADVALKEIKQLVILEPGTPYALVRLKKVVAITGAGITAIWAVPGFYNHPETVETLVNSVVGKVLDAMSVGFTR
jgi:4-hydroxy-3-polyprenylbenzoate decarboxylase